MITLRDGIQPDKEAAWVTYRKLAASANARLNRLIKQVDQAHRDAANSTLRFGGVLATLLLALCIATPCNAAVLVYSANGTYTTKTTLAAAAVAPDAAGKRVVFTTDQTLTANFTWPADRELVPENYAKINQAGYSFTYPGPTDRWPRAQVVAGNGVFLLPKCGRALPEWTGAIASAYNVTTYAAANKTAIDKIITAIAPQGGTIDYGSGWYWVNNVIAITTNGLRFTGVGSSATAISQGTHIATTSTTADVIQVNDSVSAVEGFEIENISVIGNSATGTTGSAFAVIASNGNAISKISARNCAFIGAAQYGVYFNADVGGSFIFNCDMPNLMTRSNKLDGVKMIGQVSQIRMPSLYTEGNLNHGITLAGGTTGGLTNIQLDRLTLSVVPTGYAGLNVEYASGITVTTPYSEDVAGDNIRLRSVIGFRATGGSLQQVISTAGGVVIGVDAANHPNKNHYIDIPGWTNTTAQKHIDLTQYTGGTVVDGLTLGATADGPFTTAMVAGYDTTFQINRITYLYTPATQPVLSAGTAGGTTPTLALDTYANDKRGRVSYTPGAGASNGPWVRVTFANPKAVPPIVSVSYGSADVSAPALYAVPQDASPCTYFDIGGGNAPIAGIKYINYQVED